MKGSLTTKEAKELQRLEVLHRAQMLEPGEVRRLNQLRAAAVHSESREEARRVAQEALQPVPRVLTADLVLVALRAAHRLRAELKRNLRQSMV
jgi:hypothetical protein